MAATQFDEYNLTQSKNLQKSTKFIRSRFVVNLADPATVLAWQFITV